MPHLSSTRIGVTGASTRRPLLLLINGFTANRAAFYDTLILTQHLDISSHSGAPHTRANTLILCALSADEDFIISTRSPTAERI